MAFNTRILAARMVLSKLPRSGLAQRKVEGRRAFAASRSNAGLGVMASGMRFLAKLTLAQKFKDSEGIVKTLLLSFSCRFVPVQIAG